MAETEIRIKEIIIERYGSIKKFCEIINMPWTTLDSILKRGIANSNITNVLKITKELNINAELLVAGIIKPISGNELIDYYDNMISKIFALLESQGYRVIESNSLHDNTVVIKDNLGKLIKTTSEDELLGAYEKIALSNPKQIVQNLLGLNDNLQTLAAHKDGDNFTYDELEKIEEYKKLLLAARPKE